VADSPESSDFFLIVSGRFWPQDVVTCEGRRLWIELQ